MCSFRSAIFLGFVVLSPAAAAAAAGPAETAKADAQRKKPLQRCDQLQNEAQLECLNKARQRIVEARQKREASAQSSNERASTNPAPPASGKK